MFMAQVCLAKVVILGLNDSQIESDMSCGKSIFRSLEI